MLYDGIEGVGEVLVRQDWEFRPAWFSRATSAADKVHTHSVSASRRTPEICPACEATPLHTPTQEMW